MSKRAYFHILSGKVLSEQGIPEKPVVWMGSSKRDLLDLSEDVQDTFGYAIDLAQRGGRHPNAKPMKGTLRWVTEVAADDGSGTYRAMYTVHCKGIVYVLHVFQKKSKTGRATPRADLEVIERRYRAAQQHYEELRRADDATEETEGRYPW